MAVTAIMGASGTTLKILSRTNLPGAGFTSGGVPKQGKTKVIANLTFNYVGAYSAGVTGVTLFPKDFGLETFDFLRFDVQSVNNGAARTAANDADACYVHANNQVICYLSRNAGTEATTAQAVVMNVYAEGDSAIAPALV